MAQNERQGTGTEKSDTAGVKAAEAGAASASTRSSAQTGGETGSQQSGVQMTPGTGSGKEQQGARLARREGWDDPLTSLFGGSPFALFRRLSDDMDRMFFGGGTGQGLAPFGGLTGRFLPNIDIEERDDSIVVRADLPGVQLEDFQVVVDDDALVLQGERRDQREENRGGMRRIERTYGSFRRVIPLPPGANTDAAQARFENGVLEIVVPLQQQARSRKLEVKSGGTSTGTVGDTTRH